jgi:hypothetical protein
MFGSHHHLERASPARRPVQVVSIPSHDQNASLAKQGLSAASPDTTSLCRQDYCVPGGRWSASSLRTSRRVSYCGDRTGGPVSTWGPFFLQLYRSDAMAPRTPAWCPGRSSDQCSIRPIKKSSVAIFIGNPIPRPEANFRHGKLVSPASDPTPRSIAAKMCLCFQRHKMATAPPSQRAGVRRHKTRRGQIF